MSVIVNTLGPEGTDSYRATVHWLKKMGVGNYKINIFESYEELFENLKQCQYIVMPAGYMNRKNKEMSSWVDFHFGYYSKLEFVDVFPLKVMKMIFVENKNYDKKGIVVQSATCQFAKTEENYNEHFLYANSKPQALQIFLDESYHYTLCSEPVFKRKNPDPSQYIIKHEYNPVMIWVVYKVNMERNKTNEC